MKTLEGSPHAHASRKKESQVPSSSEAFYTHMKRFPVLNKEQEQFLFQSIRGGKSIDDIERNSHFLQSLNPKEELNFDHGFKESNSIEELISNCNLRLVTDIADRFTDRLTPIERIQEGFIGLQKAISWFDYTKGTKLSTLAVPCIEQAILDADNGQTRPVHIPAKV
jgi:DNA-directed RNA polymerase sigma subunit (sigma70/sigma32)